MSIKINIIGRRRPMTTLAEHRHHIRQVHGETVRTFIEVDPTNAPTRYVQNVVVDQLYRPTSVSDDPLALNRDFVTQLWFDDMEALGRSRSSQFYADHLGPDEDNFVDQATVAFFPTTETLLRDGPSGASGWKVILGSKQADGLDPDVGEAHVSKLAADAPASILRHVRSSVLPSAPSRSLLHHLDEFWVDDETTARETLGWWMETLHDAAGGPRVVDEASLTAFVVREDVIHRDRG